MSARELRLVPVAASAWATAGAAITWPQIAWWAAAGLWSATVVVVLLGIRAGVSSAGASSTGAGSTAHHLASVTARYAVLASVALSCAAAVASNVALSQPARDAASALAVDGGRAITVVATVVSKPARTAGATMRFDASAETISYGEQRHAVDVAVAVRTTADPPAGLDVGAVVTASGTAFRAGAGEREVFVVDASRGLDVRAPPSGVLGAAATLRRGLVAAVAGLPDPGAGLVPGLAVGDTSAVPSDLDAAMKASSLSHLTAVSGANCAIVVGLAFAAAALCGARRATRVVVALAALTGFVVLVTPEPSVVRAAAMAAIAMLGVALGRTGAGVSLLSVAVAAVLVGDPWLAGSLGFALSVAATAALLILARPLANGMQRWMPRPVALALAVPLAAQLACGPLLIAVNPTVPLYGVVANLLAEPAAPVATVAGLAACLALPVPALASGLAAIAWLPAAWIAATAETLSSLPSGSLPWLAGWPGIVVLSLVGAAVCGLVLTPRPGVLWRGARRLSGALLATVVGVSAGLGALGGAAGPLTLPTDWSILACDVGQGDAVLIRSAGRLALIDTGPEPAALGECLRRVGVDRVPLLVLTHFDADHVGGVDAVIGRVDTVLHSPPADAHDRRLLARLAAEGAAVVSASAGLFGTLGDAQWRVLWPPARSVAFPSGNDASVVLDVRGGGVPTSLYLGDLGASSQRALAASGALHPPYTVVKVAHHGSADQDADLYALARPTLAIVSVGVDNDYGHPRAETLALLAGAGAAIARTDTDGIVAVVRAGVGISLWRERAPPP